jgi:hypothetical protein
MTRSGTRARLLIGMQQSYAMSAENLPLDSRDLFVSTEYYRAWWHELCSGCSAMSANKKELHGQSCGRLGSGITYELLLLVLL